MYKIDLIKDIERYKNHCYGKISERDMDIIYCDDGGRPDLTLNNDKIYKKSDIIHEIIHVSDINSNYIYWNDVSNIIKKLNNEIQCESSPKWTFTHQNTGESYKFCPNCGCKLPSDGCCYYNNKVPAPEQPQQRLIRNIHIEKDCIKFTHSNDNDTVTTMRHDEVKSCWLNNKNNSFVEKLRCLNLSDELQLYNCTLISISEYRGRNIDSQPINNFGIMFEALTQLGYKLHHGKDVDLKDFHIVTMKKYDC